MIFPSSKFECERKAINSQKADLLNGLGFKIQEGYKFSSREVNVRLLCKYKSVIDPLESRKR